MKLLRGIACLVVAEQLLACAAPAQPAGTPPTPPQPNPAQPAGAAAAANQPLDLDGVLDMLDQRGKTLDSFSAEVSLTERAEDTQLESVRIGRVWYQKLPNGQARIRVSFTERHAGGAKRVEPKDYVLENGWLLERDHDKRIQIRRQIQRPGQEVNLFKLGSGPFPMPIGQNKAEVKKLFTTELVKVTPEDKVPDGSAHVVLKPRENTELKRQFSVIDVFVDPKTQMPVKIETLDKAETNSRSTTLTNLQVNPQLRDGDFALPEIKNQAQWNIHPDEPLRD